MTAISDATRLLLSLSMLKGVGPAALKKVALVPAFASKSIWELAGSIPQLARVLEADGDWQVALENAAKQVEEAERLQVRIVSPIDAEYPQLLAETKDDPFILFVQGRLAPNPERSVAIIGTREPTAHGTEIARRITQFFHEQGWSIVSGLAIGCDAAAHQAALDVGAHTVAVLAHGLHTIAPARHKALAQDILAAGGALVSEYPFGRNVQNQQYVKRDRTQAGMSQGVVMIQSDLKGGSLHASRASLEYGRWLAVPYPTEKDRANGEPKAQANLLIADGDDAQRADLLRCPISALRKITILRSRDDYLTMIGRDNRKEAKAEPEGLPESPDTAEAVSSGQGASLISGAKESAVPSGGIAYEGQRDFVIYRVMLRENHSAGLKIAQLPPKYSEGFKKADAAVLAVLSARLQYIQDRVDFAIHLMRHYREEPDEKRMALSFSFEDILSQMRRTVDLLANVETRARCDAPGRNDAVQFALLDQGANSSTRIALTEKLDRLLKGRIDCGADRHVVHAPHGTTDLYLEDLVHSFNNLVETSLH